MKKPKALKVLNDKNSFTMKNFEEQLNNLPKAKLSWRADLKIRTRLYRLQWKQNVGVNAVFAVFNQRAVLVSVLLLAFLFTLPAYAYASPSVVEGNVLYPLKRFVEKVELTIPKSSEDKAAIYEKHASRRLEEAEILSRQTKRNSADYLLATVNQALVDKNKSAEIIAGINNKKDTQVSEKINRTQQKQAELIKQVAQNVGLEADDRVLDSVSLMISAVTEITKNDDTSQEKEGIDIDQFKTEKVEKIKVGSLEATSSKNRVIPGAGRQIKGKSGIKTSTELSEEKISFDEMVKTIKKDDFPGQGAEKLRSKLETRAVKTNQALSEGDLEKAKDLINDSRRLMKNAKFFLKSEAEKPGDKKNKQKDADKSKEEFKELDKDLQETSIIIEEKEEPVIETDLKPEGRNKNNR
jgi:hypothetical protein